MRYRILIVIVMFLVLGALYFYMERQPSTPPSDGQGITINQ